MRLVLGWLRATPTFFADEYIYGELGRSLAESGRPLIRGASASFPALLQPLVTAPAWLFGDVETSFRVIQTLGALAMSLAAVPVFLLARRLGLGTWICLALGALALAVPDLVYAAGSWPSRTPTRWLSAPSPSGRSRSPARASGYSSPSWGWPGWQPSPASNSPSSRSASSPPSSSSASASAACGPRCGNSWSSSPPSPCRRSRSSPSARVAPSASTRASSTSMWPRPRWRSGSGPTRCSSPTARASSSLPARSSGSGSRFGDRARARSWPSARSLPFVVALLVEAAAYGLGGDRIQERYFFYAVPLVGILFALYASRGGRTASSTARLQRGSSCLPPASRSPATPRDGKTNSPTLFATARLEQAFGDVATASLVVALGVTLLVGILVLASRRPQLATPVALGLALVVCTATYAGAISYNLANAERTKTDVLGPDPSFVDSTGIEGAAMLQSRSSQRAVASEYLFWNRSVDAVYLLPGAEPPDSFTVTRLTTAADGTLLANGRPVTEPLVADGFSDTIRFRDSDEIATSPVYRLVASPGPQRLALYAPGRYEDGWLGLVGSFQLWPESAADGLAGMLRFELTGPEGSPPVAVQIEPPGEPAKEIVVRPGATEQVEVAVCAPRAWSMDFVAPSTGAVGGRFVSVQASEPVYRPDPNACE